MEYINDLLKVEVQDYVALVTIDHPPLNILTLKLSAQMRDTLHCLEEDDAVRVVVLRGAGEKAFCVGADIKEFPQVWDDVIGKKLMNENLQLTPLSFWTSRLLRPWKAIPWAGDARLPWPRISAS